VHHKVTSRSRAEADAKDLYRRLQLPEPERIGYRLWQRDFYGELV
jgi:hypothetical protein